MILTHPSEPNFPIDLLDFAKAIMKTTEKISFQKIKEAVTLRHETIFHRRDANDLNDGFSVKLEMSINSRNEIDTLTKEVVIYESEDEWLQAYMRIKKDKEAEGLL